MKAKIVIFLALVAIICSLPRFGQRENESLKLSDSDYYLDMSKVFVGMQHEFSEEYRNAGDLPHHYARPFFSLIAGLLGHYVLNDNFRAAFSIINIISAWIISLLLYILLLEYRPDLRYPWLPGLLFLIGFPQINWGYHILSDTLGYATALGSSYLVLEVCKSVSDHSKINVGPRTLLLISVLFLSQAIAFATRQTGWIAVIVAFTVLIKDGYLVRYKSFSFILIMTMFLAKIPHSLYMAHYGIDGMSIHLVFAKVLNIWYLFDFVVKSAVAFNIAWVVIPFALIFITNRIPSLFQGWTIAAIMYIVAGYVHNQISGNGIGFPLRMTYALFPIIYVMNIDFIEQKIPERYLSRCIIVFCIMFSLINFCGVLLDSAKGKITIKDLLIMAGIIA